MGRPLRASAKNDIYMDRTGYGVPLAAIFVARGYLAYEYRRYGHPDQAMMYKIASRHLDWSRRHRRTRVY